MLIALRAFIGIVPIRLRFAGGAAIMLVFNRLLLLKQPFNVKLLNLKNINNWLRRKFQSKLKHDLQCQEQRLYLYELLDLVHILNERFQVE